MLQVVQCRREDMGAHIGRADMAVPLMSRIDAPSLDAALRLKCVLQYGVGVEGIDIPAVSPSSSVLPSFRHSQMLCVGLNVSQRAKAWVCMECISAKPIGSNGSKCSITSLLDF